MNRPVGDTVVARKVARGDLDDVGPETKGKLNLDEQRGQMAAKNEQKNNKMFDDWKKKAGLG